MCEKIPDECITCGESLIESKMDWVKVDFISDVIILLKTELEECFYCGAKTYTREQVKGLSDKIEEIKERL